MSIYLLGALLIGCIGAALRFVLIKRYLASDDERRLAEAARYTIIERQS